MKHRLILIAFICFSLTNCFSQTIINIHNQKNYKFAGGFILDSLKIDKPDFDSIELQVRISILNWSSGIHKKFIIDKHKSGNWTGKTYEYYYYNDSHYDFSSTKTERLVLGTPWNNSFKTMVAEDYINLPSQSEVEKKLLKQNKDSSNKLILVTADGTSYTYEFLTKKHKRKFSFKNPDSYYQFNKEQNNETTYFKMYLDLLQLTKQSLNTETTLKIRDK